MCPKKIWGVEFVDSNREKPIGLCPAPLRFASLRLAPPRPVDVRVLELTDLCFVEDVRATCLR